MMLSVITTAYLIFWGPLFLVTLLNWDWDYEEAKQSMAHEVTLHVAFVHAFVNPSLLMVLHRGIRQVDTITEDKQRILASLNAKKLLGLCQMLDRPTDSYPPSSPKLTGG